MSGILLEILYNLNENKDYKSFIIQYQNQIIEQEDIISKIRQYIKSKYSKIFDISDDGIMGIVSYLMTKITLNQLNENLKALEKK